MSVMSTRASMFGDFRPGASRWSDMYSSLLRGCGTGRHSIYGATNVGASVIRLRLRQRDRPMGQGPAGSMNLGDCLGQSGIERVAQLSARGDTELGEDVVEVRPDRAVRDVELLAYLSVGEAPVGNAGYLKLLRGKLVHRAALIERRSRGRLETPALRSSLRARSPQGSAPSASNASWAARNGTRDSATRRWRRSQAPKVSSSRARAKGQRVRSVPSAVRKRPSASSSSASKGRAYSSAMRNLGERVSLRTASISGSRARASARWPL